MNDFIWKPHVSELVKLDSALARIEKIRGTRAYVHFPNLSEGRWVEITDLEPVMIETPPEIIKSYWENASEDSRQRALIREEIVHEVFALAKRTRKKVEAIAETYQTSRAQIYRYLDLYDGTPESLLLNSRKKPTLESEGIQDKRLMNAEKNALIDEVINQLMEDKKQFPTGQELNPAALVKRIGDLAQERGIVSPSTRTILRHLERVQGYQLERRRRGSATANKFLPTPGTFVDTRFPYAVLQIDHTLLDVVVVHSVTRKPMGRPWITVAIDVYSRCVVGFRVSTKHPNAYASGLTIVRSILPKKSWLHSISPNAAEYPAPFFGLPNTIHADNGKDFRSKSFTKACEQYNIEINWRPGKTPRYGAYIERYLGTLTKQIHALPGRTGKPGVLPEDDQPDKHAVYSMQGLEEWLVEEIFGKYHNNFHSGIGTFPIKRYHQGIENRGTPEIIRGPQARRLEIAFLPSFHATFQSDGINHLYLKWHSSVVDLIVSRFGTGKNRTVEADFHYDPSRMKRIYFLNLLRQPNEEPWVEAQYPRDLPDISRDEILEAIKELNQQKKELKNNKINQEQIFQHVTRQREIESREINETKAALRKSDERLREEKRNSTAVPGSIVPKQKTVQYRPKVEKPQSRELTQDNDVLQLSGGAEWWTKSEPGSKN